MMNSNINNNIPDEVLELIPWYTIGNLSVDDQAYFDKALTVYPLLSELLKQELHIVETVSEDKTLLDVSLIVNQDERLKSVFNMIDATETETKIEPKTASLFDNVKSLLSSLVPNSSSQYVPIAGLGVLVLSVAVLTAFVTPIFTDDNTFIPASAVPSDINQSQATIKASSSELLIGFNGTSNELMNNSVLKGKTLRIEAIADKKGFYKVFFKESLTISEIKDMINDLTAQKDLVWFAGESF